MLRVKTPAGDIGTVQAYVSVAHVIFAVILIDTQLVSVQISDLLTAEGEEKERDTKRVGPGGDAARDINSRGDGSDDPGAAARKGILRGTSGKG